MKPWTRIGLLTLLMIGVSSAALAQVSQVTADARGITGASCAAIMEVALKRLEGVNKISISISQQKFQLTFRGGASFQPSEIREAVAKADVKVVRFRIAARGYVEEEKGKQFFVAGKDKFLLTASPNISPEHPTLIEAAVDDSAEPLRLKILQSKSVK